MATENNSSKRIKTRAERIASEKERNEELVTVKLVKTGDKKHRDALFVAVGGKNVLIKRGVPVKVARKYALVIEEAIRQEELTMALIEETVEKNK